MKKILQILCIAMLSMTLFASGLSSRQEQRVAVVLQESALMVALDGAGGEVSVLLPFSAEEAPRFVFVPELTSGSVYFYTEYGQEDVRLFLQSNDAVGRVTVRW